MIVYDHHDEHGRLRSFEVENSAISRGAVIRILKTVPGLVVKWERPWYRFGLENFCDFELRGAQFIADEPWGDNSRFSFGSPSADCVDQIEEIRKAFVGHGAPRWVLPARVASWVLLALGLALFLSSSLLGVSLGLLGLIALLSGGLILIATLVVARNFLVPQDGNAG